MNGDTYQDETRNVRPRLKDMIPPWLADQEAMQQAPELGYDVAKAPSPQIDVANPPQPSLKERVIGGFEGQPGGGRAGLIGRVLRGAAGGALGPTQRQDIEAERLGSQRIAGERELESQRETYGLPEQQARIGQQEAQTEQSRLATKILQRRLEMMQGAGTAPFQDMNDDENAIWNAAAATGDPKVMEQAAGRIYSRRSIEGMVGPGTTVYDPSAPGGTSRQFMTRGGGQGPTVKGAVVPGTLPSTTTQEHLVTAPTGEVQAVGTTGTKTPQVPGAPRAGGGAGVRETGATGVAGFGGQQAKSLDKYVENYRDIQQLEREQNDILRQVTTGGGGYLNGPQSMQFLANHMALTVGRVKGMRTGKDLVKLHEMARSWPQDIEAAYQQVIAGGVIPLSQARQMLGTTNIKRTESLRTLMEQAQGAGMDVQVNDATGAVRVVPRGQR